MKTGTTFRDITGMTGPEFKRQCDERGDDYDDALFDLVSHIGGDLDEITKLFERETGV